MEFKSPKPLTCAVMLPTHNRLEELRRSLEVVHAMSPAADEVLVTADNCSDGTEAFIRQQYPRVKLVVNAASRGSTASRDTMMRLASTDLVLSIDDDSYPLATNAIQLIREIFEAHPRLAVASFPQMTDEFPETLHQEEPSPVHYAATYVNCACAFRRSVFVALGGHFQPFWNAYDEADYGVRCAAHGWQIRYSPELVIRHHYSGTNRNELRVHQMHARNELWSVLLRCPFLLSIPVALFRILRQAGYAWRRGFAWGIREPHWWIACLTGVPQCLRERHPLPWTAYWNWMRLMRRPLHSEAEWERLFPRA